MRWYGLMFFFKQKTAYGVRISDWSSDVCSSDLEEQLDGPAALVEVGDLLSRGIEVVAQDAQDLAGLDPDPNLANRVAEGILAALGLALRQQPAARKSVV